MEKPAVFIASSVEGLEIADALNVNLDHETHCTLWRNGTFKLGSGGLEDLIKKSSAVDFAVFVFTPDDILTMRDKAVAVARDNVVFELGLFIGALGRDRCYVVKPRGVEMHLPSDLAGITAADYVADRPDGDTASALNSASKQIKDRIRELGSIPRVALHTHRYPGQHKANPPNYRLQSTDLRFLAECVRSHVAYTTGISFNVLASYLKHEDDVRVSLSAVKLMRLGYIEKSIVVDERDGEEFYAYRATEDGIDAFLSHEDQYANLSQTSKRGKTAPLKPTSGFDDMDADIPF